MQSRVAWELLAKPWREELSQVPDFGEYWRQFRLARGFSLSASPDPLVDGFLDCLSWYFGECVSFDGTLLQPGTTGTEDYRSAVEDLFHDWFPLFCEEFARAIARADRQRSAGWAASALRPGDDV
ncbi:hypothetical protein AB0929_29015 [Streptomyces massasporeus]|uniref:hypothetical protein n=1 Tax=Streptomyces massasporeus TaxID=67324 RepID=UPI003453B1B9